MVITPQYSRAFQFSEGLAPVNVEGKWGYINKQANITITPQFDWATPFHDGVARILIGSFSSGKFGFINKKGIFEINPQFDYADDFSEGLAPVGIRLNKYSTEFKMGYIDKKGEVVIKHQ